jgi:hypothetical protein
VFNARPPSFPRLSDVPSTFDSPPALLSARIPRSKHHVMTRSNPRKNPADAAHLGAFFSFVRLFIPRCRLLATASPFPRKMAAIVHSSRVGQLDNARRSTMFALYARSSLHHARHYRTRDYERYSDVIVIARRLGDYSPFFQYPFRAGVYARRPRISFEPERPSRKATCISRQDRLEIPA